MALSAARFLKVGAFCIALGFTLPSWAVDVAAANADMDEMTKALAELAGTPGFRGFLRSEIAKSKNRENILELDRFLERAARQKNPPPGLAKLRQTNARARSRLGRETADQLRGYDLYIPVQAHRQKWKGGKDFVVAFAPLGDEDAVNTIKGYSVSSGAPVQLDARTEPDTVVLILAADEHESHEVTGTAPEITADDRILPRPHVTGKEIAERPVPQDPGNSYIGMRRMYIRDVKEPWWLGAPEIEATMFQRKGNYCATTKIFYINSSLEYFDTPRAWRTTWSIPGDHRARCGDSGLYDAARSTCAYFNSSDYYNKVRVYIYEDDGPFAPPANAVFSLYSGVTCELSRRADDDYIDSGTIYKSNFNFEADYRHDMGNAYVYWHKVH